MSDTCKHTTTRFLACTAADRLPGVFVCISCGQKFTSDPNNPRGVRYTEGPDYRKRINITSSKH